MDAISSPQPPNAFALLYRPDLSNAFVAWDHQQQHVMNNTVAVLNHYFNQTTKARQLVIDEQTKHQDITRKKDYN